MLQSGDSSTAGRTQSMYSLRNDATIFPPNTTRHDPQQSTSRKPSTGMAQ